MDADILELLVKKALDYAEGICTFAFQGGEPTLAGLDYYRKLIELVKKHNTKKVSVNYAIQTNGLAIDKEWAEFLAENKFLVGISLDGPKELHDLSRYDPRGKGSFNRVMKAIELFNKFKVEYNILCVVNSYTARHINKVYDFFKKNNFKYLQFIPCLDPLGEVPGGHEFSLSPERYAHFLNNLFDEWYRDIKMGNEISIRYFDNLVGMLMGYPTESCGMSGVCTSYFVIEANGGVYPCDFYVLDEFYLGNIMENTFEELKNCKVSIKFVEDSKPVDPLCRECNFYSLCRGGCRRNREPFMDSKPVLNFYCSSFKDFFQHAGGRLEEISNLYKRRH